MSTEARRRAFTLVEMVTVVAIMMVLAAIAIPNLAQAQWKAKRAEVAPNVESIMDSQLAYVMSYGDFVYAFSWRPTVNGGKAAIPWPNGTEFNDLGWRPDGLVRGQYITNLAVLSVCNSKTGHPGQSSVYSAGRCDVNADGVYFNYYTCDYEQAGTGIKDRVSASASGFDEY